MSPALDYAKVAELYDSYVVFSDDIPFFVDECRRAGGPVLELMCGTGRVSIPLLEAGVDLTCTDSSSQMLDLLRRKLRERGLHAQVLQRDACDLGFKSGFPLVILPFQSFGELVSEHEQRAALQSVHSTITPAGGFICTMHNPPVRMESVDRGTVTVATTPAPDGHGEITVTADLTLDRPSRIVHGTQTIARRTGSRHPETLASISVRFSLIDRAAFEQMARECGFAIEALFGDYQRSPFRSYQSPCMVWHLRQRA